MVRAFIVLTLAVTFYFALEAKAAGDCEVPTMFKGCNIVGQQCECGRVEDCDDPWMFRNSKTCRKALFGDPCVDHACLNGGVCVQRKEGPICKCAGTGYYGDACEISCDATEENKRQGRLPDVCVIP